MVISNSGQSSIPTAFAVLYKIASSPSWPAAHIQLADIFTSDNCPIGAAAKLVMASATARRPEAGPSNRATGVRSPIAMASPTYESYDEVVTATSATGTCHGPTNWSRATVPVTERSPMLIKNDLLEIGRASCRERV